MLRNITLAIAVFLGIATQANAATCYWVGGTSTWNSSANWASSDGGGSGTCAATSGIPKNSGDIANFGSSSTGTATLDIASLSIDRINLQGTYAGTVDFNGNNVTLTSQLSVSTSGAATLTCGTGTITITLGAGAAFSWSAASATSSCASAAIVLAPSSLTGTVAFTPKASASFGALTLTWPSSPGWGFSLQDTATFASLSLSNVKKIYITQGKTWNITAAPSITASLSNPLIFDSATGSNGTAYTINTPNTFTCAYCAFSNATFTNATTMSNAWNLGNSSGLTATAPSAGGGGKIIGG